MQGFSLVVLSDISLTTHMLAIQADTFGDISSQSGKHIHLFYACLLEYLDSERYNGKVVVVHQQKSLYSASPFIQASKLKSTYSAEIGKAWTTGRLLSDVRLRLSVHIQDDALAYCAYVCLWLFEDARFRSLIDS